ncbi:type I polyketide synthase [Amphritea balenae]|uniref:SDR family NAD(P)-dependent oxidoreductase n=1 Tax=Amphritea balenae TaxID=452629 RepID=A0A3P1SW93_9GAMM|nr:type I polyketide synthase [Amphritea balenae]RRD01308.1 SDR family NAD(P)-dependent oxidoreductase [Amphritea balenae]GGK58296.1 polyketide synthase [Amphritea balenae]
MERRVAIIGYSYRLPQTGQNIFWQDLVNEKDLITEVAPSRWSFDNHLHPDQKNPGTSYTFKAGTLGDISGFDAEFFGISPREAAVLDPQQRYLLELTWEAVEHAGIKPSELRKSDSGVYIGISSVEYGNRIGDDLGVVNSNTATGNTSSIASNRISYNFDLRGPSMSIDTACSSSMVAFHQACQSILNGEVSKAITGGISLHMHPFGFIIFAKATMLSPDGRCKVFDESANGYVRSEGGGIFLLKDYDQAVADGDIIHAIVAATEVNTDGHKSGMTIPSCQSQTELMEKAYQKAGISADQLDYMEAHGTGTPVGDPIETRSIGNALGKKRATPLPIGSVKSNLGHLEPASGVAGLVKSLLVLKHRAIPATISMKNPNPDIKFDEWNIRVVDKLEPLKAEGRLTVGINSFGFGGANAHVILQSDEQRSPEPYTEPDQPQPLPIIISGKNTSAIKANAAALSNFLSKHEDASLYDIAWNYNKNKERHSDAALLFAETKQELIAKLGSLSEYNSENPSGDYFTAQGLTNAVGPVFVYTGNGCQWETMGKKLLDTSDVFYQSIVKVNELFSQYADFSLIDEIKGLNGDNRFEYTEIAQPALFALQVAITEYLKQQGVTPTAVTGHSVGEVAAAWASGALSLESAVKVIYLRSYCQGKTKGMGAMSAAGVSSTEAEELLQRPEFNRVYLAGINSHRGITLAGCPNQLANLEALLESQKTFNIRLPLDYAFHSPVMDSIHTELLKHLDGLAPQPTNVPFISTVTGTELSGEELDASYWWNNIRQPVLFKQALDLLLDQQNNCFIEIGAHPILRSYVQDQVRENSAEAAIIPTLNKKTGELRELEQCTAAAILAGVASLDKYFPVAAQRLELPVYVWQKEQHWHPVSLESHNLIRRYSEHPLLGAPLPRQPLHWENQLDTVRLPWLADHQVGESVVYPGAGFIELALKAAGHFRDDEQIEIEGLEILSPLILEDGSSKVVQTRSDADSGDIRIVSRTYSISDQWTLNCKARAAHQTLGTALSTELKELPDREPDFDTQLHLQRTLAAGLQYGPAFSAVTHGWINKNEVLAELNLPDTITDSVSDYLLHPGILDSAIQLVIHFLINELDSSRGTAFIPTRVERLVINRNASEQPSRIKLSLLKRAPHSLLTRFELFDSKGDAIAVMEGVRFRAVRLYKAGSHEIAYLDYHLTAAPEHGVTQKPIDQAYAQVQKDSSDQIERYKNEVAPLLDNLILHALAEMFVAVEADTELSNDAFATLDLNDPDRQSLRQHIIHTAVDAGILTGNEDQFQVSDQFRDNEITSTLIWNTLVRDYPDYFTAIHLAGSTSLNLAQRFMGQTEPLQVTESFQRLFRDLLTQTEYPILSSVLQQCIRSEQQNLKPGQRLQLLEVASIQPHYAQSLCAELDFNLSDFTFASNSPEALEHFSHQQERYPLTNVIDLSPEADYQGPERFPMAILTLDNYDIQGNLAQLEQLKLMLTPGATVYLSGMKPIGWLDTVFGEATDWWHQEQSCQVSADQWISTLAEHGFIEPRQIGDKDSDQGFFLITCQWPGKTSGSVTVNDSATAEPHWLVISKGTETEQQIISSLDQKGIAVTLTDTNTESELTKLIAAQQSPAFTQLLLLSDIGNKDNLLLSQANRAYLATITSRALETAGSSADIWLLTQGVGNTIPSDQPFAETTENTPSDAAIWGFTRTLMNECLNNQVHLVDLPDNLTEASLNALATELMRPSAEAELIISAAGQRFAPRLRLEQSPGAGKNTVNQAEPYISLGFELPGQLRSLQWQARTAPKPGPDEVEIEVAATGLNFRDIMYALGLLSDEAIENGFAGATMGLEFSGRVISVGSGVTNYQIGDQVVGFGSACFSNRLIATSYSIAPMPEGISFEGAATIPTTFLTVYYALHHLARLQPGEKVLIHGAAGGVGIAAVQIAQWMGAEIFATVGSGEKREFLELMGVPANRIYNSRELTYAEEILNDTTDFNDSNQGASKGVDIVLNSLAGEAINQNFRVLKPFGRFLELGKRDFYENTHIGLRPFRNNISYFGIDADQLQQELPDLTAKLFGELMQLFNEGTLFPLPYTKFNAHQIVDAFRYMQQAKQIGKIIVTYEQGLKADTSEVESKPAEHLQLNPTATYMVTGGLGGFGLRTAQWLVDKGAKHLLLLSRRGKASDEAAEFLQQCKAQGVNARAEACDVTDKTALKAVLNLCSNELPPLKGIVHAATVINDNLIRNLDQQQIETSLAAKMVGADNLNQLTRDLSLDMFVLYSSATTLLGNPGQAAYVAANHWLEALTATRRNNGLAATCVRWGAIDDVGFLARNEEIKDALQNRLGGNALTSEDGLAVLEQMLINNSQNLGVMELDWGSLSRFLPSATQNKFREISLLSNDAEQSDEDKLDLTAMMQSMSEAEFHDAILEILTHELSEILMISATKIDPDKSIYDMGMDSLMGVELMAALEARIGIQIPVMALTETPKLSQLTGKIIALAEGDQSSSAEPDPSKEVERLAAQHGESSDAEITDLITQSVSSDNKNQENT